jgi:hypothetical protein
VLVGVAVKVVAVAVRVTVGVRVLIGIGGLGTKQMRFVNRRLPNGHCLSGPPSGVRRMPHRKGARQTS